MLGALAMVGPHVLGSPTEPAVDPAHGDGATVGPGVVQANFATPLGGDVRNRGGSDGGAAGAAAPAVNAGPALVSPQAATIAPATSTVAAASASAVTSADQHPAHR
jgi:hypothetical protein